MIGSFEKYADNDRTKSPLTTHIIWPSPSLIFSFLFFQIFSSNWSKPDDMNRKLASASCWNSASLKKIEEISVVLAATMWTLLSLRMNLALYGINRSIWFIFYLLLCYKSRSWIWMSNGKVSLIFIFYYDFKNLFLFFLFFKWKIWSIFNLDILSIIFCF